MFRVLGFRAEAPVKGVGRANVHADAVLLGPRGALRSDCVTASKASHSLAP